jgi:hypothetical protein
MRYADPSLGRAGAFFTAICGLLNPLFRSGLDNYVAGSVGSSILNITKTIIYLCCVCA